MANEGATGTKSPAGAERLPASLAAVRPAYVLIHYGTNDWNDVSCRNRPSQCFTTPSLRQMVRAAKAAGTVPVVATIIPAWRAATIDPDVVMRY